jgi:hypothetical protein
MSSLTGNFRMVSQGTLVVSTSSVTFTLEGTSTVGAINITLATGSILQLIQIA